MANHDRALSGRQAKFVDEYLVDLNATQAAIRAGYTAQSALKASTRLMQQPKVLELIQAKQAKRSERTQVTADYVLANLVEVVERCMQRSPVMVRKGKTTVQATDADGNHIWQFNAGGANAALALLAKHTGGFVDRVDHTSQGEPIGGITWKVVAPEPNRLRPIVVKHLAGNGNGNGHNGN